MGLLAGLLLRTRDIDIAGRVDPTSQGRGYGSALLRYALEQIDRTGAPAYLESSNPRNVPLYERHGFKILGRVQAGSSPTVVPMLRRP